MKKYIVVIVILVILIVAAGAYVSNKTLDSYEFSQDVSQIIEVTIPAGHKGEIIRSDLEVSPMSDTLTITPLEGFEDRKATLSITGMNVLMDYPAIKITPGENIELTVQKDAWYQFGISMENSTDEDVKLFLRLAPVDDIQFSQNN